MEDDIRSAVAENPENTAETPFVADITNAGQSFAGERDQLAREKADLQDRLLRLQAEFENFRRRAERERQDFAEYAGTEVVRALLNTLDDFERAIKAAAESGTENEFIKGIELIYSRLSDTLKKQGLEPISTENAKFDPYLHHAVQMVPRDDVDDGTVLSEYQRGYNFKGSCCDRRWCRLPFVSRGLMCQ